LNSPAIACYNTDGTLNSGWGAVSGTNIFNDSVLRAQNLSFYVTCSAIQNIGGTEYVVIAGYTLDANSSVGQMALVRVNATTGLLDGTFGSGGYKYTNFTDVSICGAYSIVIENDNTILLGGASVDPNNSVSCFAMARLSSNGTVDTGFGSGLNGGLVITPMPDSGASFAYSIKTQSDGKIILGGYIESNTELISEYALARYNSNGTIDTSFGMGGITLTSLGSPGGRACNMAIQPDGKILLNGFIFANIVPPFGPQSVIYEIGIARYNSIDNITCFKEDTKILCFKDEEEKYIPIQELRSGDMVKTRYDGYVKIDMIGKSTIDNLGTDERIKDRLYKCTHEFYPEIFEDLYITGCHSILVNKLSDTEREKTMELLNDIYVTEDKYRLMACVDERAQPYNSAKKYTIYHIALENKNYYSNYGIYANGLLVETTSKRWLKELSRMELL
jgi:uncharacterized delta-60 repeat protein